VVVVVVLELVVPVLVPVVLVLVLGTASAGAGGAGAAARAVVRSCGHVAQQPAKPRRNKHQGRYDVIFNHRSQSKCTNSLMNWIHQIQSGRKILRPLIPQVKRHITVCNSDRLFAG